MCHCKVSIFSSLIILFFLNTLLCVEAGYFDWLWSSGSSSDRDIEPSRLASVPLAAVPFETKSDDEKFLQEAAKYTSIKLSELDACQHRVVMKIRGSCSSVSEEDLAKLSVNLLNCQSSVEGRQEFPCTDAMTIRECTSKMDADMWNAYHLMNNRARAVCYAARHQQFRALSEMTVNKLMSSAHDQLAAMAILKEGQHKLESMTSNTIEVVAEGHKTLTEQQQRLRSTQQSIQDFVAMNLRQLTREKALIAAGHSELAQLTKDVKLKLDTANEQLNTQAVEQQANHQQLVKDLHTIQQQAKIIWDQIEQSTTTILTQHAEATTHYEDTLVKLKKINQTVNFLLQMVDQTRLELDIRLQWISSLVGGTGDRVEHLYTCLLHGLYLLIGMIAAAFLQAPMLARLCLLLIVPCNLVLTINKGQEAALNYNWMTIVVILSAVVQWLLSMVLTAVRNSKSPIVNSSTNHITGNLSSTPPANSLSFWECGRMLLVDTFSQLKWGLFKSSNKSNTAEEPKAEGSSQRVRSWVSVQSSYSEKKTRSTPDDSSESDGEARSTPSTSLRNRAPYGQFHSPPTPSHTASRSGTPGSISGRLKPYCIAICRNGQPCRNSAAVNSTVCRKHVALPYL